MPLFRISRGIEEKTEVESSDVAQVGRSLELEVRRAVLIPAKCERSIRFVDDSLIMADLKDNAVQIEDRI